VLDAFLRWLVVKLAQLIFYHDCHEKQKFFKPGLSLYISDLDGQAKPLSMLKNDRIASSPTNWCSSLTKLALRYIFAVVNFIEYSTIIK